MMTDMLTEKVSNACRPCHKNYWKQRYTISIFVLSVSFMYPTYMVGQMMRFRKSKDGYGLKQKWLTLLGESATFV